LSSSLLQVNNNVHFKNLDTDSPAQFIGSRQESSIGVGNAVTQFVGLGFNGVDTEVTYGQINISVRDITDMAHDGDLVFQVAQAGSITTFLDTLTTSSQIRVSTGWQLLFQDGTDHIRGQSTLAPPGTNQALLELVAFGNNTVTTNESIEYSRILLRVGSNVAGAEGGKILFSTADSAASGALTTAFEIQGQLSRVAYIYSIFMQDDIVMGGNNITDVASIQSDNTPLPAGGGFIAMGVNERVAWRNDADTEDIFIRFTTANNLEFVFNTTPEYSFSDSGATFLQDLIMSSARIHEAIDPTPIASVDTITLGTAGNTFHITGTGDIDHMTTTGWQDGAKVTLLNDDGFSMDNDAAVPPANTASFKLGGGANYGGAADEAISFVFDEFGDTEPFWREIARAT